MPLTFNDAMSGGGTEFQLRGGLTIYMGEKAGALVLTHDMDAGGDVPRLMGGSPLTREMADLMARSIQGHLPTRAILPPNVLLWDGLRLAWWTRSKRRRIWFNSLQQRHLQHLNRREVTHPALLCVAEPRRLYIYALAEDRRPEADTPVYQAPYLNVYPDGWLCQNTASWPAQFGPDSIPDWERTVFDSEGTKVWAQRLTLFPGGHDALWEAMLTTERFPAESLVPTPFTVLDAVNYEWPKFYPESAGTEEIVPARELP